MRTQKKIISETTPLQIICVIAWLWIGPIIDSLDSYSYGMATRALIISFIPFVIGVIVAVAFPNFTTLRRSRSALITGNKLIKLGIKEENLRLIINRFDKKAVKQGKLLNIDEIIDKTYIRLLGIIPEEKNLMYASVTEKHISPLTTL